MQRLLLDTHTFLWWLADAPQLGQAARAAIAARRNRVYVSAATGWEIAIKRRLGKLQAPAELADVVAEEGFGNLPVTFRHGERAGALPLHHRDPFDRMLIAQCQLEELALVSADPKLEPYGVQLVAAGT